MTVGVPTLVGLLDECVGFEPQHQIFGAGSKKFSLLVARSQLARSLHFLYKWSSLVQGCNFTRDFIEILIKQSKKAGFISFSFHFTSLLVERIVFHFISLYSFTSEMALWG